MALRTKLVISFTGLLLVAIATVGVVASRSMEGILVDQIDRTLVGFVVRGPGPQPNPGPGPEPAPSGGEEDDSLRRDVAEVIIDEKGVVVVALPSGFFDDPDPLPDVTNLPPTSEPMNIPSVDDTFEYRAIAQVRSDGSILVRAFPLDGVDDATSALIRTLAVTGSVVLLVGAFATWWMVRSSMRPVDQMVDTAEAIAGGDLTHRVDELNPRTELGRLATSINAMLATIEEAVDHEKKGQERLRQFVGDASHELRTPITAISGYAQLRRQGGLDTPESEDRAWSRIEAESSRMGSLTEDLLTLTRLGQSQPLRIEDVDLCQVSRDAASDHGAIDPERAVVVRGPDSLVIQGDKNRLHQVVSSLLANARIHTPPGTQIEIDVEKRGDSVVLSVGDNGPGIPDGARESVFERFYRADPSRSRKSGGSGLGLAIVQAIVSAHHGTVSAGSSASGGVLINVTLPAIQAS
jgi:two-component system OmpR family sensor kinase